MAINTSIGEAPFGTTGRRRAFKALALIMAALFIGKLAWLQLIKGADYSSTSKAQAIKKVRVEPFRGNMIDRNGILIVHNEPSFSISITPSEFRKETMPLLSKLLNMDSTEILGLLKKYETYSKFAPVKILRDADFQTVSLIEEYGDKLPGVEVNVDSKRLYEFEANMGHVLGYTREITGEQLKERKYLSPGDIVGISGLEESYESALRGREGIQFVAVNKDGKKVSRYNNGVSDIPAGNGFDLYLTIDIKLQELAEQLLKGVRGAIVAIDPQNGEILACASKPDYDPREFSGRVPADVYNAIANDPGKPLLNRATQAMYPPGSTWKMLVAIAALNEGLIDPNTTMYCPGYFNYGGRTYKCHGSGHGTVNARSAIKGSCNTYFYQLGLKIGMENLEKYGKMFGFGGKTGIDIRNEQKGLLPTMEWLKKMKAQDQVRGRLVNYGIGQGEILTTPIQLAAYCAALANKGTYYQPHFVRSQKNKLNGRVEPISFAQRDVSKALNIKPWIWDIVQNGMFDAVNEPGGTGSASKVPGITVAGKTGTAQNPHGKDHAWFICFAPKENPKIALAIFVENAGFGGAVSAPMARQIMEAYFYPDKFDKNNIYVPGLNYNDTTKKQAPEDYVPD